MSPLPDSLKAFGLMPIEIRDVATESVVDRTVMRSLEQKFHELGRGDWLVTATLPTGKRVTVATACMIAAHYSRKGK